MGRTIIRTFFLLFFFDLFVAIVIDRNKLINHNERDVSPCDAGNKFAPCKCNQVFTDMFIPTKNKTVEVNFVEYTCAREVIAFPGFVCQQLRSEKMIYRDANQKPIELSVHYNAGCELRCVNKNCDMEKAMDALPQQKWLRKWVRKLRRKIRRKWSKVEKRNVSS